MLAPLVRLRLGEVSGVVGRDPEAVAVCSLSLRPALDARGSEERIYCEKKES